MYYSVMTQAYSEKEITSSPNRSRTYDLPITSSDPLPLSYRRLVRAEAIKLGSCDKHPAYCQDLNVNGWHMRNERKCAGSEVCLTVGCSRKCLGSLNVL